MQFKIVTLALVIAGSFLCSAQTPVTFSPKTSTSGQTASDIHPVDLNNDGITDVLQDTGQGKPGFTVSLGNGDGTFKAPVLYSEPSTSLIGTDPLVTADFNNDGKVDIVALLSPGNQVAVYLGNGDGTFQSPRVTTIALPSGWKFGSGGAAAADFNRDGKVDIVAWTNDFNSSTTPGTTALYVLQGDGTGAFATPRLVLSGPSFQPDFQVFVGDFDSDGKADIAANPATQNSQGNIDSTTVHVLYGGGDFTFTDTTPYTASGILRIGSGDLNSDGFTDLFGLSGGFSLSQQLAVFYGNGSRTFSSYFQTLSNSYQTGTSGASSDNSISQFAMGDFNGDGRMDLAAFASNTSFTTGYVQFLLAGTSPGQFTEQFVQLPTTYTDQTEPIVGLFSNSHLKPDLALNQSPNSGSPPQNTPAYLLAELNQANSGWFGPCYYPSTGQGFNVCNAGTVSGTTATFNAAVNSYGQLRKIELWVDGKKVSEQHHTWDQHGYFNYAGSFAAGSHSATFFAADVDNRLQRYDFTFTIGSTGGCNAAGGNGVYICSPNPTAPVRSPFQVTATASITGTLARMELWVDGTNKVYTETNSLTLSTTISLPPGNHELAVAAVNTAGTKWGGYMQITVQ